MFHQNLTVREKDKSKTWDIFKATNLSLPNNSSRVNATRDLRHDSKKVGMNLD